MCGFFAGSVPLFSQVLVQAKGANENMTKMYGERKAAFGERIPELFAIVGKAETPELAEAITFLIAYAPLSDLANLSPEYFRLMAALALEAALVSCTPRVAPTV